MADTKNTQTAPAGLPEKGWFTLEEVAGRWGCTVDELLHHGGQGVLELCIYRHIKGCSQSYSNLAGENECEIEPSKGVGGGWVYRPWYVAPICSTVDMTWDFDHSPLLAISPLDIRRIEFRGGALIEHGMVGVFSCSYMGNTNLPFNEKDQEHTIDTLLVTRLERDRFEREYRIGAYAGTMPDLSKSDTQNIYTTDYINIMHAAINEFFEPRQSIDAKKDEVVAWIKAKLSEAGLLDSDNVATAMFTIIKPSNHSPRKRRGSTPQSPS